MAWATHHGTARHGTAWHTWHSVAPQSTTQQDAAQRGIARARHSAVPHSSTFSPLHLPFSHHSDPFRLFSQLARLTQGTLCRSPSCPGVPHASHSRPEATARPTHGETDPSAKPEPSPCQTPSQAPVTQQSKDGNKDKAGGDRAPRAGRVGAPGRCWHRTSPPFPKRFCCVSSRTAKPPGWII